MIRAHTNRSLSTLLISCGMILIIAAGLTAALRATDEAQAQAQPETLPEAPPPEPSGPPDASVPEGGGPEPASADAEAERMRVVGVVPLPGVPMEREVIIFFSHKLAPLTGEAADDEGGAVTISDNYLVIRYGGQPIPEQGSWPLYTSGSGGRPAVFIRVPAPGTLEVWLTNAIQSIEGYPLDEKDRRLRFARTGIEPRNPWMLEQTADRLSLGVRFPLAMSPDTAREYVAVYDMEGNSIEMQTGPGPEERVLRIDIPRNVRLPVRIEFQAGLPDAERLVWLDADVSRLYPARGLSVDDPYWGEVTQEYQDLYLPFGDDVEPEVLLEYLTLWDPNANAEVPFTLMTEEASPAHHLRLEAADPSQITLELRLAAGLPTVNETAFLQADTTKSVVYELAPLEVSHIWWSNQGREGLVMNLYLSYPVAAPVLERHFSVSPEVANMRIEGQGNSRYQVYGDWESRRNYHLTIEPGLEYAKSATLGEPIHHTLRSETLSAYIGFDQDDKYYFPRRSGLNLGIESRKLGEAEVVLHQMFPSNLNAALNDMREGNIGSWFTQRWAREVAREPLALYTRGEQLAETPLGLDSVFPPDRRGVFALELNAERTSNAYKLVVWTDIGALVHWQDDALVLFTHNLFTLDPLNAAQVQVYSDKHQLLAQGFTDEQGIVRFKDFDPAFGVPRLAVVEHGQDATFVELTARSGDLDEVAAELPGYDPEAYEAFIYADRELYRPGETVNLQWLVRTNYADALPEVPLDLVVYLPNGRTMLRRTVTLNAFGAASYTLETHKAHPTGRYRVHIMIPGSQRPLGTYWFHIEEFVPNRMNAKVEILDEPWLPGQDYAVRLRAEHLFGGPARDRKAEVTVAFSQANWNPDGWQGYRFTNDSRYVPERYSAGESRTDENGEAVFTVNYTAPPEVTFPTRAVALGRVFELGGRAVLGRAETVYLPAETLVGVALEEAPGGEVMVHAAAVTSSGAAAELDSVTVTLERQQWRYYVRRYHSHHEPSWSEMFEPVATREVALQDGRGSITFPASGYGYYRVRVHSEQSPQYATASFYSYYRRLEVVDAARPTLIKLVPDKQRYTAGDEAELRIESPFDGAAFVVLQGGSFHMAQRVPVVDGIGTVRFPITAEQFPNVWAEVTVVHPIELNRTQVYPFSSFAMIPVHAEDPVHRLDVAIADAPEEIRPQSPLEVEVVIGSGAGGPAEAELTLAAVDEGIHTITGYQNPDPWEWLQRLRRPNHQRAHYYDRVAYEFEKTPEGGDALARGLAERAASVDDNWIEPVALWSGVVRTDADGRAQVRLDVPEFTGQLRLVAVAWNADAMGAASGMVYVRRPYVLRTSMPRFVLTGDTFMPRALLFNRTDSPVRADVSWQVTGALTPAEGSRTVDLAPNGEASVRIELGAETEAGQGVIEWAAIVRDSEGTVLETIEESAPLPVRPPASFTSHFHQTVVPPGETRVVRNETLLEDSRTRVEVVVSGSPMLQLQEALKHVVDYPYGCLEQTVSRLMPLYLLRQHAVLFETAEVSPARCDELIRGGISRLFALQTASGGLGFWPGASSPNPYGSVYALHFLTLVKRDEAYPLPEAGFQGLQDYVRGVANDWNDNRLEGLYLRAYATYVLALDGDAEALRQIDRFDAITIPRTARYLLAAALAHNTQDPERVREFLEGGSTTDFRERQRGGVFNSEIRNEAIELLVLLQIDGDPQDITERARALTGFLRTNRYGTTQENAFVITALGTYLSQLSAAGGTISGTVEGPGRSGTVERGRLYRDRHRGPGGSFTIANTGNQPLYVNFTGWGVPKEVDPEPVSEGLEISRSFYLASGETLGDTRFNQSQTYVAALEITARQNMEHVVVADLLPPGLEIENPRLDTDAVPGGVFSGAATPSYLDLRDDRLVLSFNTLRQGRHRFYYVVRAVTPGEYTYPRATAECMYDADIHGHTALGRAVVD